MYLIVSLIGIAMDAYMWYLDYVLIGYCSVAAYYQVVLTLRMLQLYQQHTTKHYTKTYY
jgi:hypothetical protein